MTHLKTDFMATERAMPRNLSFSFLITAFKVLVSAKQSGPTVFKMALSHLE